MPHLVRYDPSVEQAAPDEAETIEGLKDTFRSIMETTSRDYGHAVRGVHAKGHGLIAGTLTVKAGLSSELAQGIFAAPGSHEAVLRISTTPGDVLDDAVSAPRGAALKVLKVAGERLPGSEGDHTQDFVMANAPAFSAPTPKAFLGSLKLLAKTTDTGERWKKALSATLRGIEHALEAVGGESATIKALGGAPQVHPLGATYYTQTPFRYGAYVAKLSLAPVSGALKNLAGETISTSGHPDALREHVARMMRQEGGTWELRVQLASDLEAMPVEDASAVWDETMSPYHSVATFTAPPQQGWANEASERVEDQLAFSPWHGIAAHRPLGGINRARRQAYAFSATFRSDHNHCPIREPSALAELAS